MRFRVNRTRILFAVLVVALLSPLSMGASCGSARHKAVVAQHGVVESVLKVQTLVGDLAQQQPDIVTPERFKEFNKQLVPVLEITLQVNRTIRTWPPDKPAPAELHDLVTQLKGLAAKVVEVFPAGPTRDKVGVAVQIAIDAAEFVINSLPKA